MVAFGLLGCYAIGLSVQWDFFVLLGILNDALWEQWSELAAEHSNTATVFVAFWLINVTMVLMAFIYAVWTLQDVTVKLFSVDVKEWEDTASSVCQVSAFHSVSD